MFLQYFAVDKGRKNQIDVDSWCLIISSADTAPMASNYDAIQLPDTPLVAEPGQENENSLVKKSNRYLFNFVLCGLAAAVLLGFYTLKMEIVVGQNINMVSKASKTSTDDAYNFDETSFQIQRSGYETLPYFSTDASQVTKYKFMENYDAVIEPYANSSVVYNGETDSSLYFKYAVTKGKEQSYSGKFFGTGASARDENFFSVTCNPYDAVEVKIKIYKAKSYYSSVNLKAVCMYVRREIRELTESDLAAAVNAMYVMWTLTSKGGKVTYGKNFNSALYFAELHDFNAAWRDGDHIHEGLGFLPQHNKMSNLFELAMQAVDPSVTLFYWDFTKESGSLSDSPMFQESTFGELNMPTDEKWGWTYRNDSINDGWIKNGLFKRTRAQANEVFTELESGYGYMRGPWNTNPSPYITRYSQASSALPSCNAYYTWLQMSDFSEFMMNSENAPHGSTHGSIGGVFGCDAMDEMRFAGYITSENDQSSICSKWGFYLKEMYRGNYISPAEDCSTDTDVTLDGSKCSFVCNDELEEDHYSMMKTTISLSDHVPEDMGDDGWTAWRDFICTGNGYRIFVGDHLESASPLDPTFWPIHPTQDKLLQLKYMAGGFDDFEWPTDATAKGTWVCNHSQCYNTNDLSLPKDYYDECCYGHYEFDQLLDWETGNRSNKIGETNREILDASDPTSDDYSMSYIYDDFSYDHCEQDFATEIDKLYKSSGQRK